MNTSGGRIFSTRTTGEAALLLGSSNAGGARLYLDGDSNGDWSGNDYAYIEHDTSGNLNIVGDNPANASNIIFKTNTTTERLRINSGGQVLVGTDTNPAYTNRRFTVADSTNSGTCAVEIRGSASGDSRLYFTSSTTSGQTGAYAGKVKYDHANNTMGFYVNGTTEALRILSSGKVGIGLTNPGAELQVYLSLIHI